MSAEPLNMQAASATLPPEELEAFTLKLVAALKVVICHSFARKPPGKAGRPAART